MGVCHLFFLLLGLRWLQRTSQTPKESGELRVSNRLSAVSSNGLPWNADPQISQDLPLQSGSLSKATFALGAHVYVPAMWEPHFHLVLNNQWIRSSVWDPKSDHGASCPVLHGYIQEVVADPGILASLIFSPITRWVMGTDHHSFGTVSVRFASYPRSHRAIRICLSSTAHWGITTVIDPYTR